MDSTTAEGQVKINMDIVVSSMFSTCDVDRTAMLSTFGNVEFKPYIFIMHCIFSRLIFFGVGNGSD